MVEPTSASTGEDEQDPLDAVFSCLASSDRRRLAGRVAERTPDPISREALATDFAAQIHGKPRNDVTAAERQEAAVTLHHVHLPALTAAGLVKYDAEDATVTHFDHPAFQDSGIRGVIEGDAHASPESLDALFGAIADPHRRTILDVLSHQFGPIHIETLARELGVYDRAVTESDVPDDVVEQLLARLRHADLPPLSEAGLVKYDADDQMVTYEGHPDLRVPWMHSVLEPDFRPSLTGEADPSDIGEIEGREQVVSFGQSMCDRADEELFCMFTDTQLLEAGCFTRLRDAAQERDVDVYLGTRDPTVREYIEENAPEVILWEPNTDWLNLPAAGDRVGRLLLADREVIMLGSLLEQKTDGVHEEQAIIAEGEHNTLVTMICQLLNPHLEEIDEDTDDIEARLPL